MFRELKLSGTMASSNPYRYAGYRYDENTGLYYLMARYYDASVGRFITRDMFQGFENEPLTLNQYAYTNNNPVTNIDPSGHSSVSSLAQKAGYAAFFWAIRTLYEGLAMFFWGKPSALDWGLWSMKAVIVGQAGLIGSQLGPFAAGIVTTAAYIGSDLISTFIKKYAYSIKKRSASTSSIAYWAARDLTNYLFF